MKKMRLPILSVMLFSSALYAMPIYAGAEACDSASIHCAYSSDSVDQNHGNYIKVIWKELGNVEIKACLNYGDVMDFSSSDVDEHNVPKGNNTWVVEECSDASYTKCLVIAADQFKISKNTDGTYSAAPKYFPFSLKGFFPAANCLGSAKSSHAFK
jgi:hypothetical protein